MKYMVEMMGGKKMEVTEERGEILMKVLSEEKRPEYINFTDIYGRKVVVRTDNITKVYDATSDISAWMDAGSKRTRNEKFDG